MNFQGIFRAIRSIVTNLIKNCQLWNNLFGIHHQQFQNCKLCTGKFERSFAYLRIEQICMQSNFIV